MLGKHTATEQQLLDVTSVASLCLCTFLAVRKVKATTAANQSPYIEPLRNSGEPMTVVCYNRDSSRTRGFETGTEIQKLVCSKFCKIFIGTEIKFKYFRIVFLWSSEGLSR